MRDRLSLAIALSVSLCAPILPRAGPLQPLAPVPLRWTKSNGINAQFGSTFTVEDASGRTIATLNNSTTNIIKAVSASGLIIVLGWTQAGNLVTVFNGATGTECLELLCYDPHLSPNAEYVVFRRFFPPTTSDQLVRDSVAVLSISAVREHKIPCITAVGNAPPMDLGTNVYPARPRPDHRIFGNFIWQANSESFFFVDVEPLAGFLLGRADMDAGKWTVHVSTLETVPGPPDEAITVRRFATGEAGHLVVEAERDSSSATRYQTIYDPQTLLPLPSEQQPAPAANMIPADIPWAIMSRNVLSPDKLRAVAIGSPVTPGEAVPVQIIIAPSGTVAAVHVRTDNHRIKDAVTRELMTWQFKPTVVDGRPTAVTTTLDVPLKP